MKMEKELLEKYEAAIERLKVAKSSLAHTQERLRHWQNEIEIATSDIRLTSDALYRWCGYEGGFNDTLGFPTVIKPVGGAA